MKTDPNRPRYRTGRSVGRTIYERAGEDWVLVGVMDTVELAAAAVEGLNGLTEHVDDHYLAQQRAAATPAVDSLHTNAAERMVLGLTEYEMEAKLRGIPDPTPKAPEHAVLVPERLDKLTAWVEELEEDMRVVRAWAVAAQHAADMARIEREERGKGGT